VRDLLAVFDHLDEAGVGHFFRSTDASPAMKADGDFDPLACARDSLLSGSFGLFGFHFGGKTRRR
jgi:hypothetical protein